MDLMNIGQAATAAGVSTKMVRHYEAIGLLPPSERSDAGYRLYGEREVAMLRFIRQSRSLGFSMAQIGDLLSQWRDPDRHSAEVKRLASQQLAELAQRQQELDQMRASLDQLVRQCAGDHSAQCAILDGLGQSDPAPLGIALPKGKQTLKVARAGRRPATGKRRVTRGDAVGSLGMGNAPAHAALSSWMHLANAAGQTA